MKKAAYTAIGRRCSSTTGMKTDTKKVEVSRRSYSEGSSSIRNRGAEPFDMNQSMGHDDTGVPKDRLALMRVQTNKTIRSVPIVDLRATERRNSHTTNSHNPLPVAHTPSAYSNVKVRVRVQERVKNEAQHSPEHPHRERVMKVCSKCGHRAEGDLRFPCGRMVQLCLSCAQAFSDLLARRIGELDQGMHATTKPLPPDAHKSASYDGHMKSSSLDSYKSSGHMRTTVTPRGTSYGMPVSSLVSTPGTPSGKHAYTRTDTPSAKHSPQRSDGDAHWVHRLQLEGGDGGEPAPLVHSSSGIWPVRDPPLSKSASHDDAASQGSTSVPNGFSRGSSGGSVMSRGSSGMSLLRASSAGLHDRVQSTHNRPQQPVFSTLHSGPASTRLLLSRSDKRMDSPPKPVAPFQTIPVGRSTKSPQRDQRSFNNQRPNAINQRSNAMSSKALGKFSGMVHLTA